MLEGRTGVSSLVRGGPHRHLRNATGISPARALLGLWLCLQVQLALSLAGQAPVRNPAHDATSAGMVSIEVSVVTKDGRPATGLAKGDFELTEDNVRQTISDVSTLEGRLWAALVLDESRSLRDTGPLVANVAARLVRALPATSPVSIFTFSDDARLLGDWSLDHDHVAETLWSSRPGRRTTLWDTMGLLMAAGLDRVYGRAAIFLFTDGEDNSSKKYSEKTVLEQVRRSRVQIHVVLWRGPQDICPVAVRKIASESGGSLVSARVHQLMDSEIRNLADSASQQYRIDYYPSNRNFDGRFRAIKVRVASKGLSVRTRSGYVASKPQ